MADTKTSDLTAIPELAGADVIPIVDATDTVTKKVSITQLDGRYGSGVLDAMNSTQQVVNTTVETTVATLAVPAGAVDAADTMLVVSAVGSFLQNTGTATHTYRLKIDGTTVMTMVKSLAASGNLYPWTMRWTIACPTNASQRIGYEAVWGATTAASDGVATFSTTGNSATGFSTKTVDMSGAHDITLTIEQSAAAVNIYDNVYTVTLEKSAPLA